jgi:hypothetical protein
MTGGSTMKKTVATVAIFSLCLMLCASLAGQAQEGTILLTIFLKHDQSKTLAEIGQHLEGTEFWKNFPPEGMEVVSWYVMMGIGQVVTLRVPAERLRDVNLAIERGAWGAFRTEFYPTYDFKPIWQSMRQSQ